VHFHGQDASEELRKKDMIAYYKWMGQHVAGVIAVSKPMASRLIEVGIPPEKVRVVHSGIDIPEKTIEPPFTPPCRLLSVSRLVPKKGLLHLLKAFEMAKQEVPEITLDIIGEGPLRNEVEEFVAVHGLTESVRLHGQRPHDDVLNMLGQCHIFAQHSVTDPLTGNAEGLPVTVLEACGQGRPVLSTFHEGIPEAVEHGVSGYLVDEGDTGKMAEYMVRLSQDGGLRAQMGQAARAKVMNGGFSTDAMLSELRKAIGLSPSAKGLCTGASVSVKEKTEAGYPKTFQPKAGRAIRNVLFVNHNLAPYEHSGTPISTLNHALGMKAKGLEVAVLIPSDEVKKGFQSDHVDGFTLYRVPRFEKHKAFFNDIDRGELESYLKDIEAVLRRFSPDVIQVNDYVWMPGEIFEVFSKRGSLIIRNVCNLEEICHRDYPVVAEGACGKLCSGPESASKCSECYCAQSLQRWGSEIQESEKDRITEQIEKRFEFIRYLYDEVVDGVVFTEPRFREFFSKFVRIPEKKVNIIPRGFRFEFQKRGKAITVSGSELHFAFVGNLMFSKGVDVVLRAFESVAGYDGFKLHLFGAVVNDEYLPWIKGLEKRFPQKIIYHGAFEKKDLPDIARGIHVCIVPSYFDTFNRVVREMLYFGVPVLSTDFFGSSVVQDHLNGLKVAVGDWQALADRMMDLVKSPDLVHRLSTGAVNCHIAELDQEVSGLLKTYSALTPSEGMEKGCRVGASDSPMSEQHFEKKQDVRLIAFYLPQFHPIPENDVWWGKGFTEWTTVTKAKPLFPGHDQPRIPSELGFYDLRLPEVRKAQADLAREHGVYGFCYYHYWFNGKLLLERPLQEVLSSGEPDFPFCLCWANENWTRAWDGGDAQILIQQHYSQEDDIAHIRYLCCIFQDRRYIRINGKPLLLIYRAKRIPDPLRTTEVWRKEAKRLGIGELYLCRVESFPDEHSDPTTLGFDAAVEFQPDWGELGPSVADAKFGNHAVYRYPDIVDRMLRKRKPPYRRFPCVTPSWDNSPRRKSEASIFIDSSPALYEKWLKRTVERCSGENPGKIIFINAWNEWGEGNHLEPDLVFGRDYLEATRRAVERAAPASDFHPTHRAYEDVEGLVASGKENEALSALEDIVATDPTHALAHNDLGCLYYGRGDKERTLVHLEKAVALNPHHLDSLKNLADFYCAEAGRGEDALRLYLRIISDFPEDLETLRTLGSLFVRLNRIGDALPLYKKILTREPEDPEAKHVLEQLLPIISLPGQQPDPPSSLKFHKEPPLVSVLLPAFELTEATLNSTEAFLGNAKKDRVEVLLILKGSPPAVRELADSAGNERIKLLTFPEGTSLTAVLNGAGRKATGRFLAFMDHRIPLSHTWLRPLLDTLLSHPEMAAVSPKVAGADHSILEAGYSRIENDRVRGEGAGGVLDDPRYSFLTRIPSLSRHLAVVARDVWMRHGGFDERLTDFGLAMMDLGFSLGKGGHLLSYQPRSIVHPNNGTGETPSGCGPVHTDEGEIKSPRPSVVPKAEDPESAAVPRKKVLVLGVYLANQPNTAEDMISIYGSSKNCEVFQRWVGLGGSPPSPKVAEVTVRSLPGKKPKFEIMNELLLESPVEEYDYVLLSDDDVVLPENFLDHFIPLQQRLGFVIAQPARTSNSYIDHPIVQQHPGIVARETRFVEIGPVVSFHRSAFEFVFPFDLTSSMGWGYENVWSFRAKEKGLKIGIIDQTPVDHSLRKPVANYDWSQADRERSEFLKKHSHLPIEACFSVTRVIHPQEVPSCQQT
jgi:glycosyltransferase involved in cell wall biosynthesis/tetratricopeptide (TPR) repeat protein